MFGNIYPFTGLKVLIPCSDLGGALSHVLIRYHNINILNMHTYSVRGSR